MATGIYADKRWTTLRARILRRDGYLCQQCLRYGKHRAATTVHHCYQAGMYPDLAWERWNLVSLCTQCHDAMHDRGSDLLTALGEQWRRRADQRKPPPPPALIGRSPKTGTGNSLPPRRVFGAGGDRAGTKQSGARTETLEADFLGRADFARKSETFPAKQRPGACPKWTQKERET